MIASETAFTQYVAVFAEGLIQKRKPEANGSEGPKAWRLSFFPWEENPRQVGVTAGWLEQPVH